MKKKNEIIEMNFVHATKITRGFRSLITPKTLPNYLDIVVTVMATIHTDVLLGKLVSSDIPCTVCSRKLETERRRQQSFLFLEGKFMI